MLWHLVQHQNLSWWSGTSTWDRKVYRVVDWILQKKSLKFKSHLEGQNIFGRSLINLGRSKSSIWLFHMRIHEGGNQPVAFGLSQKWVRRIKVINIRQLISLEESLRQITFELKSIKFKTKGGASIHPLELVVEVLSYLWKTVSGSGMRVYISQCMSGFLWPKLRTQ